MESLKSRNFYDKKYFQKRGFLFPEIKGFVFALFVKLFLMPKTLLDVGCGEGTLVKWATRWRIDAWGIDITFAGFSKAKNFVRRRCQIGNVLDLPYKDEAFEVVSSLAVMEHIRKEDTERALSELLRVCQKYVFLQICVRDNPFEGKHFLLDPTHVNVEDSSWWLKKFQKMKIKTRFSFPRLGLFLFLKKP
ncbi:MAG: class I SAM-dependent methyltransferase [Patescibacteria group bacterium]